MDPYRELGVERGATPDELRRVYRDRVRRLHPDSRPERNDPAADEELRRVTAAWRSVLAAAGGVEADEEPPVDEDDDTARAHPRARSRLGIVLTLLVLFLLFVVTAYAGSPSDEREPGPSGRRTTTLRGGD